MVTNLPRDGRPQHLDAHSVALATTRAAAHGLYVGQGELGPVFSPAEHGVLVVGPPRSGKTTRIVLPNVLAAAGSVVSASTKADIMSASATARRRLGPCWLFDPSGKIDCPRNVERVGWSPLTAAAEWDDAVLVAEAMVGAARPAGDRGEAAHWSERAGALLACVVHGAALEQASIDSVVSAVNRHDADRLSSVLARNGAELAADLLAGILSTDGREQSGIWSTASSVLAGYRTASALSSARLPLLDVDELLASRGTLYLVAPSEHQRHSAAIVAGIVRDVRSAAYRRADYGGRPDRAAAGPRTGEVANVDQAPLLLALDELAGIAPLHDLPTLIAEGASQGIVTLACLQDLSQARARWGAAADGFLTLFGTKVVLPGVGDTKTLEALSVLAGEHEVPRVATTRSVGLIGRRPATRTLSIERVRRLPPAAVANGLHGSALVFVGTQPGRVQLPAPTTRGSARAPTAARSRDPVRVLGR